MTNYITTTISTEHGLAPPISVFTVEPENQHQLVDLLVEATTSVIQHQPGFISANIHASLDGARVVNYAQWRSRQDLEHLLANPTASEHMQVIASLALPDPRLYDVTASHHA